MATDSEYAGKVVVITGASSGFGRGAALELAKRGAFVVLAARSAEELHQVARECQASAGRALPVPTDVSDIAAVERLSQAALNEFGHFDVWINNAGVGAVGRFDAIPLADHEQVIRTNLLGTIAGSHVALRHFRAQGQGTLINIASIIGKIPAPLYSSYAATKFGVVGLSDVLRQELRQENLKDIHVVTVMPMAHTTPFFEHAANYTGHDVVPIPPAYDPKVTIDALVKLVRAPEDEVITGWQGGLFNFLHQLMPHTIENMMARNTQSTQLESAPVGANGPGTVHQPAGRQAS